MSSQFSYILEENGQVWFVLILESEKVRVREIKEPLVMFRCLLSGRERVSMLVDYHVALNGRKKVHH